MTIAHMLNFSLHQSLPFPEDYPDYVRRLTGLPEAYVVFGFPNHIPLKTYVRAIPGMTTMINFVKYVETIAFRRLDTVLTLTSK